MYTYIIYVKVYEHSGQKRIFFSFATKHHTEMYWIKKQNVQGDS